MIESLTVFDTRVSIASTVYTYTSHEQASLKTKSLNVRIQITGISLFYDITLFYNW